MYVLKSFRVESRMIYVFILMCFSFPCGKDFSALKLDFSFRLEK